MEKIMFNEMKQMFDKEYFILTDKDINIKEKVIKNLKIFPNKLNTMEKIGLIEGVVELSIQVNDIFEIPTINKYLCNKLLDYIIITEYTNIKEYFDFEDDKSEEYIENILLYLDVLENAQSNIFMKIEKYVNINDMRMLLEQRIEEYKEVRKIKYSSVNQILEFIQNFKIDNLEEVKSILEKFPKLNSKEVDKNE